jgi:GT2 family glycosyltransferase
VCIVTYGTCKQDLERGLESVFRYVPNMAIEVIVVDNASTDDTATMIAERFPSVIVIRNSENLGYAPAMNLALKQSTGKYVLSLSVDAEILPDSIQQLVSFMEEHPKCGLAGPCVLGGNGEVLTTRHHPNLLLSVWGEIIPIKMWLRKNNFLRKLATSLFRNASGLTSDYRKTEKVRLLSGGVLMSSRQFLDDVGFLDGNMPLGPDDYDWCYRAIKRGYEIWFVAESSMIHRQKPKEDPLTISPISLFVQLPCRLYYYQKYHKGLKLFLFRSSLLLLSLKWRWRIRSRYGAESMHYKAIAAGHRICSDPETYHAEVANDWPAKFRLFSAEGLK